MILRSTNDDKQHINMLRNELNNKNIVQGEKFLSLFKNNKQREEMKNLQLGADLSSIESIFEQQYHAELFYSRCQDTGDKPDREKAKMFKESLGKINSKKYPQILNLYSMRLGVNTIMKLISILENKKFSTINIADNSISQYGMHAVKSLISTSKIQHLNLASNMISEVGLSLILDEMTKNQHIKTLDLGILQGSIRKNSFGIDGARCLAAILLQNKKLQTLKLQDNDIGINGAEILSIPLKRNKYIKELKLSQNLIKTQGAQYILNNAINLVSLDLGKNFIKSSIGPTLKKYLLINKNLKKLNLELNQIRAEGANILFQGLVSSMDSSVNQLTTSSISSLQELNLKGNAIGNNGINMIHQTLQNNQPIQNLKILDLSCNQLNDQCIDSLIGMLNYLKLTSLNISRNNFGDQAIMLFVKRLKTISTGLSIQKIDLSATKMSEKSFIFLLQNLNNFPNLKHLKCTDNYISQKLQKVFVSLLQKNQTLISLNLQGNRLSLSGTKAIKKVIDRNLKKFEEKQPSIMKSEIYNLRQKQKKIKEAQQKIQLKKKELNSLQDTKNRLAQTLSRLQTEQKHFKKQNQDIIKRKISQLEQIQGQGKKKEQILLLTKEEKQKKVKEMESQLKKLRQKRKALEYQLSVSENEGKMIQKEFQKKFRQVK